MKMSIIWLKKINEIDRKIIHEPHGSRLDKLLKKRKILEFAYRRTLNDNT